jgi:HNH endonuclease
MKLVHFADSPRSGLCGCGCGAPTAIAKVTRARSGWIKGQPQRALTGHRVTPARRTDPIARFWSHVNKTETCWLWTAGTRGHGYGLFRAVPGETMKMAHRFSWELANGPIPEGVGVLHNCPDGDNPLCVNPAHLFLGTQIDNMRDCSEKGRMPRGEQRHAAKLTATAVVRIRELAESGRSMQSLAREYGVSGPTVQAIVHRRKWRWVA